MCKNMKCEIDLTLDLHYEVIPWETQTYDNPGHPGEIEITAISLMDIELSVEITKKLLNEYEDIFVEHILDNNIELNFM